MFVAYLCCNLLEKSFYTGFLDQGCCILQDALFSARHTTQALSKICTSQNYADFGFAEIRSIQVPENERDTSVISRNTKVSVIYEAASRPHFEDSMFIRWTLLF